MAKSALRSGRLGDLLHRELSRLIREECTDPRLGMVTISAVVVTEDLSFARVYVTVMQDDKRDSSVEALNHAAGFFRSILAKSLTLRIVPRIKFIYDDSLMIGNRMDQILNSLKEPKQNKPVSQDESE